ncbi:unnamed protein product [Merluccius merluccius]
MPVMSHPEGPAESQLWHRAGELVLNGNSNPGHKVDPKVIPSVIINPGNRASKKEVRLDSPLQTHAVHGECVGVRP